MFEIACHVQNNKAPVFYLYRLGAATPAESRHHEGDGGAHGEDDSEDGGDSSCETSEK